MAVLIPGTFMKNKKKYLLLILSSLVLLICFAVLLVGINSEQTSSIFPNLHPSSPITIPALRCIHINSGGKENGNYEETLAGVDLYGAKNREGVIGVYPNQYNVLGVTGISRGAAEFDTRTVKSVSEATLVAQVQASTGNSVIVYTSSYPLTTHNEVSLSTLWHVDSPVVATIDATTVTALYPSTPYTVTVFLPPDAISPGGTTNLMFRLASEGTEPEDTFQTGSGGEGVLLTNLQLVIR